MSERSSILFFKYFFFFHAFFTPFFQPSHFSAGLFHTTNSLQFLFFLAIFFLFASFCLNDTFYSRIWFCLSFSFFILFCLFRLWACQTCLVFLSIFNLLKIFIKFCYYFLFFWIISDFGQSHARYGIAVSSLSVDCFVV